ncbi:MAG: hypothetical protein WC489_03600 [Patescibacteria group bacterium]
MSEHLDTSPKAQQEGLIDSLRFGIQYDPYANLTEVASKPESLFRLNKAVSHYMQHGAIAVFERNQTESYEVRADRAEELLRVALLSNGYNDNGRGFVTVGQLMAFSNLHPTYGYYNLKHGVGKISSAFTTPLELDPEYSQSYGKMCRKAYEALGDKKKFTKDSPFTVFVVGDGNGRITNEIVHALLSDGIDPEGLHIIIVDASQRLLDIQTTYGIAAGLKVTSIHQDARSLHTVINRFRNPRGVIIAGEELVDDFPSPLITRSDTDIFERGLEIYGPNILGMYRYAKDPYLQKLWREWTKVFPEYVHIATSNKMGETSDVPLNVGFLSLLSAICSSDFTGYFLGGDYCTMFKSKTNIPHQGIRFYEPPTGLSSLYTAAATRKGVLTVDVDPRLLTWAAYNGMTIQTLTRMGHFIDAALDRPMTTQVEIAQSIPEDFTGLLSDAKRRELELLHDRWSGNRFNWILAKGNVPPLLYSHNNLW